MKVMTVLGTRPEIIRLSRIIPKLDQSSAHVLVHTGQNFDPRLSDVFFQELGIRRPDHFLDAGSGRAGRQIGEILARSEELMLKERPDRLLILGDTNSALSAFIGKRLGIPVYHMEAGNRCFDARVPEEVNRRVIDHSSDIHMPYTERSRAHLLAEGLPDRDIYVVGNPIHEVLRHYQPAISASDVLERLSLEPGGYFLVTMHRAENVDSPARLQALLAGLGRLWEGYRLPLVVSTHPRTRDRLRAGAVSLPGGDLRLLEPFGLFDFVALQRSARCVLSDSGTVQEECCLLGVPNVTLRDVTERPETLECGSNLLAGADPESVARAVGLALSRPCDWTPPREYLVENVSEIVVRILYGARPLPA